MKYVLVQVLSLFLRYFQSNIRSALHKSEGKFFIFWPECCDYWATIKKISNKTAVCFSENLRQNLSTDNDYIPVGSSLDEAFRYFNL